MSSRPTTVNSLRFNRSSIGLPGMEDPRSPWPIPNVAPLTINGVGPDEEAFGDLGVGRTGMITLHGRNGIELVDLATGR